MGSSTASRAASSPPSTRHSAPRPQSSRQTRTGPPLRHSPKPHRVGERFSEAAGDTAVALPEFALQTTATAADVTESATGTLASEGPVEGGQELGRAAGETAVDTTQQTAKFAAENPGIFAGGVVGGAAASVGGGVAASRGLRRAGRSRPVRAARDRLRTAGGDSVPLEDLTTPPVAERFSDRDIAESEAQFPGSTRPELIEADDPAAAIRRQSEATFSGDVAARFDEAGVSSGTVLTKELDVEPGGPGSGRAAQGLEAPEADSDLAREFETAGTSTGPAVSPNFLRVDERPDAPTFSFRPGLPTPDLGPGPTSVALRTEVENPDARSTPDFDAELRDRAGDTEALAVRQEFKGFSATDEVEAQVPPEAEFADVGSGTVRNAARRLGIGADLYTRVDGRRVPIRTVAPESELPSSTFTERLRARVEGGPVGAGAGAFVGRSADLPPGRRVSRSLSRDVEQPVDRPLPASGAPTTSAAGADTEMSEAGLSPSPGSNPGGSTPRPPSQTPPSPPSEPTPSTPSDPSGSSPSPSSPGTPSTPSDPSPPSTPSTPSTPSDPSTPSTPSTPAPPGTPSTPSTPDTPGLPGTPSTPGIPGTPSAPSDPGPPGRPRLPEDTDDEREEELLFTSGAVDERFINPIERLGDPDAGPDIESPPAFDGPEYGGP